jgi:hypothetical protein
MTSSMAEMHERCNSEALQKLAFDNGYRLQGPLFPILQLLVLAYAFCWDRCAVPLFPVANSNSAIRKGLQLHDIAKLTLRIELSIDYKPMEAVQPVCTQPYDPDHFPSG